MNSYGQVDLALVNGKIVTMDGKGFYGESVAIKDGKILEVNSTRNILNNIDSSTKKIDLHGKTVTPGFIESHCHPSIGGPGILNEVVLKDAESIDDIIDLLREKALDTPRGQWIIGRMYDDRKLKEQRHPIRTDLDKVSTEHPVYLRRICSTMSSVNSVALHQAGISVDSNDPEGGRFDRDDDTGQLNGLLRGEAQSVIKSILPSYSIPEIKEGILAVCSEFASYGITSFTDMAVTRNAFVAYQELLEEGALPLRVGVVIPWFPWSGVSGNAQEMKRIGINHGFGNDKLRIIGTKFYVDGGMSSWTAALYAPYSNEPGNVGILKHSKEELTQGIVESHKAGLRPCTHAIGDRAIDEILDAIEEASKHRPVEEARLRIEKCTIPTDKAIQRIKRLGIIPSTLTGFLYELGSTHLLGIGKERIQRYFPHKRFIEEGIIATSSSDWSVTSANVAQQLYGLVTRKSNRGDLIGENQAIGIKEALKLHTINAAYASFEENIKGTIEPGKLADMTVFEDDIVNMPSEQIINAKVDMTIVGGEIVYKA